MSTDSAADGLESLAEAVWNAMPARHTGWRGLSNEDRDFYRGIAARLRDQHLNGLLSAAATRARAEGAAEVRDDIQARRREFRRLNADPEYLNALDDAYGLANNRARSDAAPHAGAQPVDWDSPTWGGGVHHATTDDLGDHGRHADETDEQ